MVLMVTDRTTDDTAREAVIIDHFIATAGGVGPAAAVLEMAAAFDAVTVDESENEAEDFTVDDGVDL